MKIVKLTGVLVIGFLVVSGAAWAAATYGVAASLDGTGLLELQTNQMDKGWFNKAGTLDRTKSDIATDYTLGATTCSAAKEGVSYSSVTEGMFVPVYNTVGTAVIGYRWNIVADLSGSQNHWYYHTHCDATVEVHGCDQAISVSITSAVADAAGACRTLDDGTCASASTSATLPAVQDPSVVETDCGGTCDLGTCVSSCESECNDAWPVGGRDNAGNAALKAACNAECHCSCKEADPDCTIGEGECD